MTQPNNAEELQKKLRQIYSANFNDGDPIAERYGSTDTVHMSEVVDFIDDFVVPFIQSHTAELEKSYGGCHKCWGKGYATYSGEYRARDMRWPDESIRYCDCERGKQLEGHVREIERKARLAQLDELIDINGETFNRWTQKDIAHFFDVVGKRYRELESSVPQPNSQKEAA